MCLHLLMALRTKRASIAVRESRGKSRTVSIIHGVHRYRRFFGKSARAITNARYDTDLKRPLASFDEEEAAWEENTERKEGREIPSPLFRQGQGCKCNDNAILFREQKCSGRRETAETSVVVRHLNAPLWVNNRCDCRCTVTEEEGARWKKTRAISAFPLFSRCNEGLRAKGAEISARGFPSPLILVAGTRRASARETGPRSSQRGMHEGEVRRRSKKKERKKGSAPFELGGAIYSTEKFWDKLRAACRVRRREIASEFTQRISYYPDPFPSRAGCTRTENRCRFEPTVQTYTRFNIKTVNLTRVVRHIRGACPEVSADDVPNGQISSLCARGSSAPRCGFNRHRRILFRGRERGRVALLECTRSLARAPPVLPLS